MTDRLLLEAQRVERAIGRVRWGAAAIALLLGPLFPTLSVQGVYALGAGIVLYNVAALAASRRAASRAAHATVARAAFAGDIAALAAAMVLFSADPGWTTFMLGPLVITTGAFRFGTGGTLAASLSLGTVYTATVIFRDRAFGYAFEPERVLFTLSVYALTAVLVDRVMRDSRQLRTEREDLIARLERRIAEDAALAVATKVVATVAAPDEVIPRVLHAARAVLLFDRATVFVADEARDEYRVLHRLASGDDDVLPPRAPLGHGLVAAALAEERPILVPNVLEDPRYEPRPGEPARSVILVPLRVGGRAIAVFTLSRALPDRFTDDDLRLSGAVAALIAQTLENQRLFAQASEAQALREIDRLKDEFLAAVSHELRTPLTVVSGALELLGRQAGSMTDQARTLIAQAERHAQRLTRSVGELLEIAQLQEAKVELDREFIPCDALLAETAAAHEALAGARGQRIVIAPSSAPPVYVDRRRMLQVLANLVSNAIRYSPDGAAIELSAARAGDVVELAVADEGPGIPADERERVFDKFVRLRRDRDVAGGTGLGLAIAKDLVGLHGGRIRVEDGPRGARFVVALPHEPVPAAAGAVG
ncbi:MAG TPA: ATP-binding protein [Candidatus Limnocylindria bacterium]|nr:ATP-binding protein [Candidatus Limnocylindria bacterium]